MSIGKRRIDLNRSRVALHCSVNVLHLFECVSHVAVGVGKVWVDTNGFLVMAERLLEPALHLQDAGEIGVGRGKFRVNLEMEELCNIS